ncbi:MAG: hypothetical protein NXH97_20150 [Rhodobacteraceae bacterium]|nr:hypothetical protein [Paracoccaceae bacterium]
MRSKTVSRAFSIRTGIGIGIGIGMLPVAAHAYVGPGAGLTAIGTLVALFAALILAIVGFVWYPVKRLLRAKKASSKIPEGHETEK